MSDRKQREKSFHNKVFSEHPRKGLSKFYKLQGARETFFKNLIEGDCRGKMVLEYGCGPGSYSFSLAKSGAQVVGIDISEVAIEQAKEVARREGVEGTTRFLVMDAENLKLGDEYFDLVCGGGIIHHLDPDVAFSEISRVLKPDGRAVFLEPLGYNPLINIFRRLTPDLRTKDEHPLKLEDFKSAERHFNTVNSYYFDLCTLLALPFSNATFFDGMVNTLRFLDNLIFRIPFIKWFSWATVLELSGPEKFSSSGNIKKHAATH